MLTVILIAATALLVAADQLSKLWAVTALRGQPPIPLWPGVFELEYRENTGVAFSLLEGQSWVFIPLTLIVMILFIVLLWRSDFRRYRTFRAAAVLIVAGGVGNLIDRIRLRYVVFQADRFSDIQRRGHLRVRRCGAAVHLLAVHL